MAPEADAREEATAEADVDMKDSQTGEGGQDGGEEGGDQAREAAEENEPEPAKVEEVKELEEDAPTDSRAKVPEQAVALNESDLTINAMPTCGGKLLMGMSDSGFQHLLAGARCNTGIKANRYYYEVRIIEQRNMDYAASKNTAPKPSCCFGFSPRSSDLLMDGTDGVGFDSEGYFLCEPKKKWLVAAFQTGEVYGILLNLDSTSANANTISLFRDGVRDCPPQPLPESLKGKVLFPTVNFKSTTLLVHFGAEPLAGLPFKCPMLSEAAKDDVELLSSVAPRKDRPEVLFPVCLPDEGSYTWLDGFLQKHSEYTELSNRKILDWGLKSGIYRARWNERNCNDNPALDFGVRELDDGFVRSAIHSLAAVLNRDYVVMEVKNNLLDWERKNLLALFDKEQFRRVALVVMGEPPAAFKAAAKEKLLAEKKRKAAADARLKASKEATEEEVEIAVKEAEEAVTLTEEEKQAWFSKSAVEDLTKKDLSTNYGHFSLPDDSEGFDEIRYEWNSAEASSEYLKEWISERKLMVRVEDLQAGDWFRDQYHEWNGLVSHWRKIHSQWRDPARRADLFRQKRQQAKAAIDGESNDHKERDRPEDDEKERDEKEQGEAEENEEREENGDKVKAQEQHEENGDDAGAKVVAEDLDVFVVDDVCDIGSCEPLFANFTWQDWMLMSLRFELHLLVHAYRKDVNDPERSCFHESHLTYYYNKYYKKPLSLKSFGVNEVAELVNIVKDSIEVIPKKGLLDSLLSDDSPMDNFVKLTEDCRRERLRAIDAGDESAELKLERPQQTHQGGHASGGRDSGRYGQQGGGYQSRGSDQSSRAGGGYQSRAPPPPAGGRSYPPPVGGVGGYGATHSPSAPRAGYGPPHGVPYGAPPMGYPGHVYPPPPVHGGYGMPPPHHHQPPPPAFPGGAQRRPYNPPPPDSHGGYGGPPPQKVPRSSYSQQSYGSAPPPPPPGGGYGGGHSGGHRDSRGGHASSSRDRGHASSSRDRGGSYGGGGSSRSGFGGSSSDRHRGSSRDRGASYGDRRSGGGTHGSGRR